MTPNDTTAEAPLPALAALPGAAGQKDWSATALGVPAGWPPALRAAAGLCLASQFPLAVVWGPEFIYVYNEAAASLFGSKHPWALGQRVVDVWPEAIDTVGPLLESVYGSGQALRCDDQPLMLAPDGSLQEVYLTFSYSPVLGAGGAVEGVLVAFMDTSARILEERRQRTMTELASAVAHGRASEDLLVRVREVLDGNPRDLPFTILLEVGAGGRLVPRFCTGLHAGELPAGAVDALMPLLAGCLYRPQACVLDAAPLTGLVGACGPWPEPPREMLAMPFRRGGQDAVAGLLLAGVNPRRPLDPGYRAFFDQLSGHVAHAVAVAESDAAGRARAAAMAELERSRSHFFANASHELRTPLTMLLGPLGALLEDGGAGLPAEVREPVEMAYRNARRLHKLVNALMDFAHIEAGSLPLLLAPVDPGEATAEVAALFRGPMEAAGLRLALRSALPPGELLLDREAWEKIVFNLLSNAFKFTHEGAVEVHLGRADGWLELVVADTGIGIGAEEIEWVFDRFYRSRGAAGRGGDGSGVGLALVRELARMLGGETGVESRQGAGSRFVVRVPWREAGQHPEAAAAGAPWRVQFQDELGRHSLPGSSGTAALPAPATRVAVLEQDEDLVRYIVRLLRGSCAVTPVRGGDGALAAIRAINPDLVLFDTMLPGCLALLRRIRSDPVLRALPVLALSARSGEDARLEALAAGADECLAKPFTGRELITRVGAHVQMARVRRAASEQETLLRREIAGLRHDLATVLDGTRDTVVSLDRELRVMALNDAAAAAAGQPKSLLVGAHASALVPELAGSELERVLREAIGGRDTGAVEHYDRHAQRWQEIRCYSAPHGALLFGTDVTGRKLAEQAWHQAHADLERRVDERTEALHRANGLLTAVFDRAPGGIALTDPRGCIFRANAAYAALVGLGAAALDGRMMEEWIEPGDMSLLRAGRGRLLKGARDSFEAEVRYRCPDGRRLWVSHFVSLIGQDWNGEPCFVTIARDISARRRTEAENDAARQELGAMYKLLQSVRENERKALAREVHDQLGQTLSAAKIDIKLLEDDLRDGGRPVRRAAILRELGSAGTTIEQAIGLVRKIATELRAPELDEHGLYAAIAWQIRDFARRTRIECHVSFLPSRPHPARGSAVALLRIFQEATTNVLRHAQAKKLWVSLERRGDALVLRVRDDGIGIARGQMRRGRSLGLQGMRERAELVGGKVLAGPLLPHGTLVSARVPLYSRKGPRP